MTSNNGSSVLESELLKQIPWLIHGFGTRLSGSWPGEYIGVKQIHSNVVVMAAEAINDIQGDAVVLATPGEVIGIRTADCVPILLADRDRPLVAAAHAGWRGTAAGIAVRTVERMRQVAGTHPSRILAAIGPSIGKCCFAVGPEVASEFPEDAVEDEESTCVDLKAANFRQLLASGVQAEHIDVADLCTRCEAGRFHSFRRDLDRAGRMVSAIGIRGL